MAWSGDTGEDIEITGWNYGSTISVVQGRHFTESLTVVGYADEVGL